MILLSIVYRHDYVPFRSRQAHQKFAMRGRYDNKHAESSKIKTDTRPAVDSTGVQTRAKRRSIAVLGNDENNNPFITRKISAEVGKSAIEGKSSPAQTRPAKHGATQSRISTPNKINALFSVTKSATSVNIFKDGKPTPVTTPQTPRHRDALSKKVAVTPRHRVQISHSPATPRTPSSPSTAAANVYNQARQLFARCTDPGVLIGRDDEKKQLSTFISECIDSSSAGCLYISGPPGTGKSAFVGGVCEDFTASETVAMSTVNCMSVKNAKDLATTLCTDLSITIPPTRTADFDFLRSYFLGTEDESKKYIVVLDEIDRLVDLDLKLLYSLFEWSMMPNSSLILIGIANALDLTDRFLPRLKSRNLKPDLLPFMPYTAPQIVSILTSKLKSLLPASTPDPNHVPFLHPAAITFIAKKVSSQTGDLRKAFDIAHRAISLIESETRSAAARLRLEQSSPSKSTAATPLMENINLCSPPAVRATPLKQTTLNLTSTLGHFTVETAPRATIAHAAKITAQVFSNGTSQRLQTLNLNQKAVLCSLSALEKKKREAPSADKIFATPSKKADQAPTIKQLYETYSSLCKRENLLAPLTSGEFRDVVGGLETLSLIQAVEGKNGSFSMPMTPSRTPSRRGKNAGGGFSGSVGGDDKRVAGCVGFQELLSSLKGAGSDILREILESGGI